ncbi:MAG: hypothetical protein P4L84_21490 [Isosphaeraceae bacterium]|nr:hypothetical protein [Isosphaeraceae bacterium]
MPGDAEPAPDDEAKIADAELLFTDAPVPRQAVPRPETPGPASDAAYDIQESDQPEPVARPPIVPPTRAEKAAPSRPGRMTLEPSVAVEQVWTRWAEWGTTLTILVAAAAFLVLLLYFALSFEAHGFAVFLLFAGGLVLAILSYPILITLERPVRVTPEQAVRDFYGALSHHVPHYRRMWLLLSRAGRTSASFASFEGFQNYWRTRLAQLRGDRVARTVPLKFQMVGFKAAKSSGLSTINVTYVIEVYARGNTGNGPIATVRIQTSLVKGPDRMWYLDLGSLPEA